MLFKKKKIKGFTLSEVLIVIAVIGVVAAITLPSVINNSKEREYVAARKRILHTFGEALRLISVHGEVREASNAEDFVNNYLKKHLQIVKTCDNSHLRDCGIETGTNKIISLAETKMTMPKTIGELAAGMGNGSTISTNSASYGFVLSSGYSINLFYNPNCISDVTNVDHQGQDKVCVNAIYDINGLASPNEVGKDIGFVTIIYPEQSVAVAPDVARRNAANSNFNGVSAACTNYDKDYSPPNKDELLSMYYNGYLLGITSGLYWSSSPASEGKAWVMYFGRGYYGQNGVGSSANVRCVRR